jgi:hypothetical protein
MTDLESRLRQVDRLEPPDLWDRIEAQPRHEPSQPPLRRRALSAFVALLVAAAAVGLTIWAFRDARRAGPAALRCVDGFVAVPHPSGPGERSSGLSEDSLFGVAAFGPNEAWTVGFSDYLSRGPTDIVPSTTILHWDGHVWTVQPAAVVRTKTNSTGGAVNEHGRIGSLVSVAGSSPSDVWAVGDAGFEPLIEHWDGNDWTRARAGLPSSTFTSSNSGTLLGVAVAGSHDAWAVGSVGADRLIEHWDGSSWRAVDEDHAGTGAFAAVSASGSDDVWAVGQTADQRPVTEQWDGHAWRQIPSVELTPRGASGLSAVAAVAPNDVWAVGWWSPGRTGNSPHYALIEHWDGARWHRVTWNQGSPGPWLNAVVATGGPEVWVGGWQESRHPRQIRPLLLHWDGKKFDKATFVTHATIQSLAFAGSGRVWAVGDMRPASLPSGSLIAQRVCHA